MQQSLWDKIWKDKNGNVVLFQMPNAWIIAWVVLTIISMILTGTVSDIFWYAGGVALAVWSLLEIFQGVNYFRRALGVIVLALMIASHIGIGK